ncbi:MAG: TonB-dependent receptor [Cytophagales bacterium]|nr:MAG: TonB-dependent receptor [Cytophagales bacterium]
MRVVLIVCVMISSQLVWSQNKPVTLNGRFVEAESGEPIPTGAIVNGDRKVGATANKYGYFSVRLNLGNHALTITALGYETQLLRMTVRQDTSILIRLKSSTLPEVIVRKQDIHNQPIGVVSIPVAKLTRVPMLLGEADILKALALTPGVTNAQEGTAGLIVRGSGSDQNLMLLDDAPVYNATHAFGFLSVFNPDAVRQVELYKGGFPARYGGRLASVLNVTMKEGNNQRKNRDLSIGVVNSRLLWEGPIRKGVSSYMVSGRLANTFLLALPTWLRGSLGGSVDYTSFVLFDVNAKVNHQFKDNSQLFLSFYKGQDYLRTETRTPSYQTASRLNWGNSTATLRYNKPLRSNLFARALTTFTHFANTTTEVTEDRRGSQGDQAKEGQFKLSNTIRDWSGRVDFDYILSRNYTLQAGVEHFWHAYAPGVVRVSGNALMEFDTISRQVNQTTHTQEQAVYLENQLRGKGWQLNAGLRVSSLAVKSTRYYGQEPRLSAQIQLSSALSIKAGYSIMYQYMHQLSTSGAGLPTDIWVPSTDRVKPASSRQAELGIYWTIDPAGNYTASLEGYSKRMSNLIDYQAGVNLMTDLNRNWEGLIALNGIGRSYGLETMIQKKEGKISGWLSYAYARSFRRFDEINNGQWYPYRYDRPHVASLVLNMQLNKRWSFNLSQQYQTGYAVTLPTGTGFGINGEPVFFYTGRNQERMPDFHRMDVGATYEFLSKRERAKAWTFGLYNAYGRQNPFYISTNIIRTPVPGNTNFLSWPYERTQLIKQAVFPILPYVTYRVKL